MSILTDIDLKKILCIDETKWNDEKLLIQPFSDDCLTIMGYDLRVGGYYQKYGPKSNPNLIKLEEKQKVEIKPGETALISTLEKIHMPADCSISALLLSKVTQVAKGLSHISTKIDPNWVGGTLTIPISNFSKKSIYLDYGEQICSVVFFENKSKSIKPPKTANTDRFDLAQDQKLEMDIKKIAREFSPITILIIIPCVAWFSFGEGMKFTASILISVALFNFVDRKINSNNNT